MVGSDAHGGLTLAIAKHFQPATWQRCQVHLMRKLLSRSPVKVGAEVAGSARRVFQASDSGETHSGRFSGRTPNAHPSRYRRDERRAVRPELESVRLRQNVQRLLLDGTLYEPPVVSRQATGAMVSGRSTTRSLALTASDWACSRSFDLTRGGGDSPWRPAARRRAAREVRARELPAV